MQWLIDSVKGGNVLCNDLHASGLNLIRISGGGYWEISVSGFLL